MAEETVPDISSSEVDFRSDDPAEADCRCYMRVDGVSGLLSPVHDWALIDASLPYTDEFAIEGVGDTWSLSLSTPQPWPSLPSDYIELHSPSNGLHMFYLVSYAPPLSDFAVYTTVKCYSPNKYGEMLLRTTTHHDFLWKDVANSFIGPSISYGSIWKEFACYYFTTPIPKN